MRPLLTRWSIALVVAAAIPLTTHAAGQHPAGAQQLFSLGNATLSCTVTVTNGVLSLDRTALRPLPGGSGRGGAPQAVITDADFALEVVWSDWRAPGKNNNADNPVILTKKDFTFQQTDSVLSPDGTRELRLYFSGQGLLLRLAYRLGMRDFYVRRSIAVTDSANTGHFLRALWGRDGLLQGHPSVVKGGDFGQPVALRYERGGAFFGLEQPASSNRLEGPPGKRRLRCGEEIGEKIGRSWLEGSWVVLAVTPDANVQQWFWRYVDDIRVAPLKPYTLYNSWYDLRAPDFKNLPAGNVMNEENIMRIIGLINKNMIGKHGIPLDAFVLDDGWDIYKSDWVLRKEQFPHGLRPIADELRKSGTALGMWLGPTGGYSFRDWRIGWMKDHGYEIVNDQLCLAGKNYSALFRKRVVDLVRDEGVAYFKWDGIQFACNETDHGHPIDIYSRRAVLRSVIDKCDAVRAQNPNTFLNITSGTWLSPWWVSYANQIWMDGQDYGYADVPSISPRDAAITYRDFVLFEDFKIKDLWFPIANMMTHGIIKGNLQKLGGENEPLDKFTNEALLYFARGVSMWELYISPDILTDGEWDAMATSMQWARDRFPILATTTMIGGDPKARETYGYAHFKGNRGIIAARNPFIEPRSLLLTLAPAQGLDPRAASLVLERVYPSHWISPQLFAAGSSVRLPLDGYETALYELYPVSEATGPLLAGVVFETKKQEGKMCELVCFPEGAKGTLLNPAMVSSLTVDGRPSDPRALGLSGRPEARAVEHARVSAGTEEAVCDVTLRVNEEARNGTIAFLLKPERAASTTTLPAVRITADGRETKPQVESQKGMWAWYVVPLGQGEHHVRFALDKGESAWHGTVTAYYVCDLEKKGEGLSLTMREVQSPRIMPPSPTAPGTFKRHLKLGALTLVQKGSSSGR